MEYSFLLNKIEKRLKEIQETIDSTSWGMCSIYKFPWCMKVVEDSDNYTPSVVSLGPYHYGKFKVMDEFHKYRALSCMLNRKKQSVVLYLEAVIELEHVALSFYEYNVVNGVSRDVFSEMLLLDTCFILEILLGYRYGFRKQGYLENDPVFSKEYMKCGILRDMILLENQIPLVVLERLHDLQFEGNPREHVIDLIINLFNPISVTSRHVPLELADLRNFVLSSAREQNIGIQHCLDIFRQTLMYSSDISTTQATSETRELDKKMDPKNEMIPSVSQLKDAGVKFKKRKESFAFWDITFTDGVMEIPQIVISDTSESMLLNLMAFEQCHLSSKDAKITSYIALLDNLVNSPSDAKELFEDDILIHTLGDDEKLANVLNRLARGIYFTVEVGCYRKLYKDVNEYCKKRIPRYRATLVRDYCSSPWVIIALIAAILELTFSFVQTIK